MSSGLTVMKEFLVCRHDSCDRMRFARTHDGYALSKKKLIMLYYISSHCSSISGDPLRKDCGVENSSAQKFESDRTEAFHRLNSLIWKWWLIRSFLDDLYELYRHEICCWCVPHCTIWLKGSSHSKTHLYPFYYLYITLRRIFVAELTASARCK